MRMTCTICVYVSEYRVGRLKHRDIAPCLRTRNLSDLSETETEAIGLRFFEFISRTVEAD